MRESLAPLTSERLLCHSKATLRRVLEDLCQTEYSHLFVSRRKTITDDRRTSERFSIQVPIQITPVTFDGERVECLDPGLPAIHAMTRDLTLRGVGFMHQQLLCGDYALLACDLLNRHDVSLLVELRWTNCRKDAAYMSGGRFESLVSF